MQSIENPDLCDDRDGRPILIASRCEVCGRVAFPPISIGCDRCGADGSHISPHRVEATGTIHASVIVHPTKPGAATYQVVEVQLDAGPLIRGLAGAEDPLIAGDRVDAAWATVVSEPDPDRPASVEPRFQRIEAA